MLDMLASLQSFGRSPVSIDTWKIFCNIGVSWTAHSLIILLGILSGPDDFDALTFDSNFSSFLLYDNWFDFCLTPIFLAIFLLRTILQTITCSTSYVVDILCAQRVKARRGSLCC